MRRKALLLGVPALLIAGAAVAWRLRGSAKDVVPVPPRTSAPRPLDPALWVRTSAGDFEEDVVETAADGRVRLRAATRGTRDDTVKFLGVRSTKAFPVGPGTRLGARLDWNAQANGSYLSGALILSPEAGDGNPLAGPDWLKVEYVGVPPGENARLVVACRTSGRDRTLHAEGWPQTNKKGRKVSLLDVEIVVEPDGLRILENGAEVFETKERPLSFPAAHLYLQLSTHSNYPPRELYFDRVRLP